MSEEVKVTELSQFIERIERLEGEKRELSADIREVYKEAAGRGYDKKVMKQIVKLRKMNSSDRAESEYLRNTYKKELGLEDVFY